MGFTVLSGPDDPEIKRCHYGRIADVCEVSANFCKKLEGDSVQSEFKDKKKIDAMAERIVHRQFEDIRKTLSSKRERDRLSSAVPAQPEVTEQKAESVEAQLNRLRDECHLTAQELAELIDNGVRSVQRHLAGECVPYDRHIRAYEREFSKLLNRKILIKKMS